LAAELAARGLGTEDGKRKVQKVSVQLSLQCMAHICLPFHFIFSSWLTVDLSKQKRKRNEDAKTSSPAETPEEATYNMLKRKVLN
jgi:hypothetical protein